LPGFTEFSEQRRAGERGGRAKSKYKNKGVYAHARKSMQEKYLS
jgi:hypothetical protein